MFLKGARGWTMASGEQRASGPFLIVYSLVPGRELRACVRSVQLHQLGHFMMGRAKIGDHYQTLSGAYGQDGLTRDPPYGLWEHLVPLPPELCAAFWKGDGHNTSGSEGPAMHQWGCENIESLRQAGRKFRLMSETAELLDRYTIGQQTLAHLEIYNYFKWDHRQ